MIQISIPPTRRKARIEIIPLIDIIFFLLATFVLVSMSMVKNQGLPIRLPVATASKALDQNETLIIRITQDGALSIDKQFYTPGQLGKPLHMFQQSHHDPKVVIQGDTEVAYGKVIQVLDAVRLLGISKVAVQTTAKPS